MTNIMKVSSCCVNCTRHTESYDFCFCSPLFLHSRNMPDLIQKVLQVRRLTCLIRNIQRKFSEWMLYFVQNSRSRQTTNNLWGASWMQQNTCLANWLVQPNLYYMHSTLYLYCTVTMVVFKYHKIIFASNSANCKCKCKL